MAANTSDLSLHKAVFGGNIEAVEQLLKKMSSDEVDGQDIHGNTALHIACMKGNKRCVELLVTSGALTTVCNQHNWMSLHEAISYGDISTIKILNDALSQRMVRYLRRDNIFKLFNKIKEDFVMKFEVRIKDFKPTSVCGPPEVNISLTKKGHKIKVDLTVTDCFHSRPDTFHLIFDLNESSDTFIIITVGNNVPVYQRVTYQDWEEILNQIFSHENFDEEILTLRRKENICIKIDKESNRSDRPFFRKVVTKTIGKYKTDVYESQDIELTTKTRTEHLLGSQNQTNESLPPPVLKEISWDEYINAPKGLFPHLGREKIETIETKSVSIVVGVTKDIDYKWNWIIKSMDQIFSHQLVATIRQMCGELPEGFPVVVDLPIKPHVYVKWSLKSFEIVSDIDETIFTIPRNYEQRVIFRVERNNTTIL